MTSQQRAAHPHLVPSGLGPRRGRPRAALPPQLAARPFTTAEAARAGVSEATLRSRAVTRVYRGVYVDSRLRLTLRHRVAAALLVLPADAVVSGVTGLQVRGIDVGPDDVLHFASQTRREIRLPGVVVHRRVDARPAEARVQSVEACWLEAVAQLGLIGAVAAAEMLLHQGLTTLPRLRSYVAAATGTHGVKAAREAIALVREGAESWWETWLRLALVMAGLPEPAINAWIEVAGGRRRGDLVYQMYRVLVEYDGRWHELVPGRSDLDLNRSDDFVDDGWSHVRITRGRAADPRAVVMLVHRRLVAGGYRGPAPRFGARWIECFERRH